MPLYASYHTDYVSPGSPDLIDEMHIPYIIEAPNAEAAMQESAKTDGQPIADVMDDTAIINLDLLFRVLENRGWRISPPVEEAYKSEIRQAS